MSTGSRRTTRRLAVIAAAAVALAGGVGVARAQLALDGPPGDADCNGAVELADAHAGAQLLADRRPGGPDCTTPSTVSAPALDLDADGAATPEDLDALLGCLIGEHPSACTQRVRGRLVDADDISYLGRFALPPGVHDGATFAYGGDALAIHRAVGAAPTLWVSGHRTSPPAVAEVAIPTAALAGPGDETAPAATIVTPFFDITDGALAGFADSESHLRTLGSLGDLILVGASEYYDADATQSAALGVASPDPAADFSGFVALDAPVPPRATSGYLTAVPPEWSGPLGGSMVAGECCMPIISATSAGPAAIAFDPRDLAAPATRLLFYPVESPLAPVETGNDLFNLTTVIRGAAIPPGSSSLLFIGRHGTGDYCYGPGTADPDLAGMPVPDSTDLWCYDPTNFDKGTHAWPYRHQIWAYDLVEVAAAVGTGTNPAPYAVWPIELGEAESGTGLATIAGATFDPETRRWYLTVEHGEDPHVHVLAIGAG